jgi:hypothetical protein
LGIGLFALVSRRAEAGMVTAPMVFIAFGFVMGGAVSGVFEASLQSEGIQALAEITLVVALSRIKLRRLGREHDLPLRLLRPPDIGARRGARASAGLSLPNSGCAAPGRKPRSKAGDHGIDPWGIRLNAGAKPVPAGRAAAGRSSGGFPLDRSAQQARLQSPRSSE